MKSEELIEKVVENISNDRKKLLDLFEKLENIKSAESDQSDIFLLKAVSEDLVKIADSLTKQNGQIVELAKLKQKSEHIIAAQKDGSPDGALDYDDLNEIYNEVEKIN